MARDTWYRLDNIGKFYSSQAGSNAQTVFRFSATMTEVVDQEALQKAVDRTVETFSGFNVCLRSGMFWHYLEPASESPVVSQENLPICFGLHVDTRSVLIRISYWERRINVEVSHMVSDGLGTMSFFKALIGAYVYERYGIGSAQQKYDGSDKQKSENSFDKYFEPDKAASTPTPKAYQLTGWRDTADPTYFEYHLPAREVLDLARTMDVSLTALLIAVVVCAVRAGMPQRERNRAICVGVPVDLRQVFDSATLRNFFGLAFVSYTAGSEDEPIEAVAKHINSQLKEVVQPESLKMRMNRMVALEKNLALRFAPLFVKDAILEIADSFAAREVTTTVSNLGRIVLDDEVAPFVQDINILTSTTGLNFTLCSFGNDLSIGISTVYANPDVVKDFCRYFSRQGITGVININKTTAEVAEDYREARIEESMKRISGKTARHKMASSSRAVASDDTNSADASDGTQGTRTAVNSQEVPDETL